MTNAHRVAVNTGINYIQLILNVVFNLLTVRIILQSLGEIDYGIYNLIAGVIALITFISESLSQTSVRFISVSMGEQRNTETKSVFSSCFSLHLYMGGALAVLLELIGIFLFDGFLNIPPDRVGASIIVFHCMVMTLFINVIATPFRAMVIANEQFWLIAIAGILDSALKLMIAFIVLYSLMDKLVLYGIFMAFISFVPLSCFSMYSLMRYREITSLQLVGFRRIKDMIHFAGWTLLDVFGAVANRQGYALMFNKFFGPSTNAVFALSSHVESPLFLVSASAINSIKPQILKSYGSGDLDKTMRLSMTAGKIGFSLMAMLAIPICVMLPDILKIWLGEYPPDTVFFARMMIIASLCSQLTIGLISANQAIGNIKWFSIIVSCLRMSALPVSIALLLLGASASMAMVVYMLAESFASVCRVIIMRRIADLKVRFFVKNVVVQILPPCLLSAGICLLVYHDLNSVWGILINVMITALVYAYLIYSIGLTSEEKNGIKSIIISVRSTLRKA
ncbi:MAG: hypothetical protein IJ064_06760 [Bacteroidaceae bacterium]|nr:hypothetical protein [Bacteroidaceae bacterium]